MGSISRKVIIPAMVLAFCSAAARGQTTPFPPEINTEQNPLRNVRQSALRAPGHMVNAGVVRTVEAANFATDVIEITEPLPGPDPKATFLIEAMEIIFGQVNNAILLLENALRLRAGLPPRVPIDLPTNGGDTDGDTTDDGATDASTDVDAEDVRDIVDRLE